MTPKSSALWGVANTAILVGLVLTQALPSFADEPEEATLNQIVELNKKALLAYDALDMETASALLHEALNICKREKLDNHPTAARTHLHLGVVYLSGLKFPELGLAEFREALTIDPKIQITKSLLNPEVEAAFEKAQKPEEGATGSRKRVPFPTGQELTGTPTSDAPQELRHISHPPVTRATRGQAIEIKAQVAPGMGATKVVLAYMAQNASDFLAREMTRVDHALGWFHESIPAKATRGTWVAYYIEAQDANDQILARNGSPENPHQITLAPESAAEDLPPSTRSSQSKGKNKVGAGRGLWLVLAIGSGGGYHRGAPEMNPRDASGADLEVSGLGAAELMHVAPEIGFFQNDNLIFSAQGRFQYVTGTEIVHLGQKTYHPPVMAFAGLAKATWLATRPGKAFQTMVSAGVGAGQIRHTITTPASANLNGCGAGPTCKDTVLGGLGLLGAGVGVRYLLRESVGLYAALEVLAGLPNFMVNADLNIGFAVVR